MYTYIHHIGCVSRTIFHNKLAYMHVLKAMVSSTRRVATHGTCPTWVCSSWSVRAAQWCSGRAAALGRKAIAECAETATSISVRVSTPRQNQHMWVHHANSGAWLTTMPTSCMNVRKPKPIRLTYERHVDDFHISLQCSQIEVERLATGLLLWPTACCSHARCSQNAIMPSMSAFQVKAFAYVCVDE
jgi:hypothetical protein